MAQITLPCGRLVVFDDTDLPMVSHFSWHACRVTQRSERYYAASTVNRKNVYMHRLLLGFPPLTVDHRNNDGLDNRRSNLRPATRGQNNANRATTNPTGFRGVFPTRYNNFQARISDRSRPHRYQLLGKFATAEDAARAYDDAAIEKWGEFARLNFPDSPAVQKAREMARYQTDARWAEQLIADAERSAT